jgi:TolB protein
MTNNYSPRAWTIRLSRLTKGASTIAAVSLAAAMVIAAPGQRPAAPASQRPPAAPAQQPPPPAQPQQPSEVAVVITGDPGTPPRYAVPDFIALSPAAAETAKTIGQVLWDDLDFEQEFYMIPRDTYSSVPAAKTLDSLPFDAWRELGADAVVFGTVQQSAGKAVVQVRLVNVRSRRTVFAKEYFNASNARVYAHTIADEIHQQQRQLRGVARTKLAFVSDRNQERLGGTVEKREVKEIYTSDYDGANQRRITVSRQLNLNPSWSSDARILAYSSYRPHPDIFLSYIYQGLMQNPTKGVGTNYMPVFSPDGRQIAFMSARDNNPEIYVINADGSNLRRLTNHPAGDSTPTWSPSGDQIAFTSDRTGSPQIYVVGANGSNVQRITFDESWADRPTWSRAPYNEIAYSGRTGAGFDIKVYDVATRQIRQITFGEGSNESPAYSPSGRHLAFTSTRYGSTQVFTIGRNGRGLRQITRVGNNQTPAWSN